jgi:hypothetical protein
MILMQVNLFSPGTEVRGLAGENTRHAYLALTEATVHWLRMAGSYSTEPSSAVTRTGPSENLAMILLRSALILRSNVSR